MFYVIHTTGVITQYSREAADAIAAELTAAGIFAYVA